MGGTILVVDDVAANRIVLKAKLADSCYDVLQAASGPEALSLARSARPGLILLELALPGMGGIEVLAALAADRATADIPVVVVTARADARSRLAALRAGAEDYLVRPVDDALLAARVRSLLRARLVAEDLERGLGGPPACGLAEAPGAAAWAGARAAPAPARVALVGPDAATTGRWRATLAPRLPHRFVAMSRAEAMRLARVGSDGARPLAAPAVPEAFLLAADLATPGEGLRLLTDLRSGPATCHAAILVALDAPEAAAAALDLGAGDVLARSFDPEEAALRLSAQLRRARAAASLRRRLQDRLHRAETDELTGLLRRAAGFAHLEGAAARAARDGTDLAVLLLDLDRFKAVNDAHGHAAGDAVLRGVAGRLRRELPGGGVLARVGGEEFLAVLPGLTPGAARALAERLRRAVRAAPVALPRGGSVRQTVSIGLACAGPGAAGMDAQALYERADDALYAAKSGGRDRVETAVGSGLPAPERRPARGALLRD